MGHVQFGGPHAGGDAAEHAAFFADAQLLQLHGGTWRRGPARPAPADPSRALLRTPRAANSAAPRGAAGTLPGGLLIYMRGGPPASLPARPPLRSPPPAPPPGRRGAGIGRGVGRGSARSGVGMEGRGSAPPRWAAIGARASPPRLPAPSAGPFLLLRRAGRVCSALLLCPRCPSPPQSSPWPPPPQVTRAATVGCRWGGGRGEEGVGAGVGTALPRSPLGRLQKSFSLRRRLLTVSRSLAPEVEVPLSASRRSGGGAWAVSPAVPEPKSSAPRCRRGRSAAGRVAQLRFWASESGKR